MFLSLGCCGSCKRSQGEALEPSEAVESGLKKGETDVLALHKIPRNTVVAIPSVSELKGMLVLTEACFDGKIGSNYLHLRALRM